MVWKTCKPKWVNGTCPGTDFFLITTWPHVNDPQTNLDAVTVGINVFYSLLPILILIFSFGFILWQWLSSENPTLCKEGKLRDKLANCQLAMKYICWTVAAIVLNYVQHKLLNFIVPDCSWIDRPPESCLHGPGMPCEWSMWASGLFVMVFIDLMLRWAVPHLTSAENPVYTQDQMQSLGYTSISASRMVGNLIICLLVVGPIPMSRVMVRDSSYMQCVWGLFEGGLLAVLLHIKRISLLGSPNEEELQHFLLRRMVRGGFVHTGLVKLISDLKNGKMQATGKGKCHDLYHEFRKMWETATKKTEKFLKADEEAHQQRIQNDPAEPLLAGAASSAGESAPPTSSRLPASSRLSTVFTRNVKKVGEHKHWKPIKEWRSVGDIPGLEFLAIRVDVQLQKASMRHDLEIEGLQEENAEKVNQMRAQAEAELRAEQERLEKQAAEIREKANQEFARQEQEAQERLENQRQENQRRLEEQEKQAQEELDRKKQEAARIQAEFEGYQRQLTEVAESLSILQTAQDEGDIELLGRGLQRDDIKDLVAGSDDAQTGHDDRDVKHLFRPVAKLADEVYTVWSGCRERFREELRAGESSLQNQRQNGEANPVLDVKIVRTLFNALTACCEHGLVLKKDENDRKRCERVEEILHKWAEKSFTFAKDTVPVGRQEKSVHKEIITKAIWAQTRAELGSFDATDLETCLQTVDRAEAKFKKLALNQVMKVNVDIDGHRKPVAHLVGALQQLSTLIFFLDYINKENLDRTYKKFKEQLKNFEALSEKEESFKKNIEKWIDEANQDYKAPDTLLQAKDLANIDETEPKDVIDTMENRELPGMDVFKDIFVMLARVWEKDFGVLVVPHHTQVVSLLVFKAFLNGDDEEFKTLIGQVSTGEGKSMLIASLALFVVSQTEPEKRKRVHVIGNDEKLVQRDFESFKGVFNEWRQKFLPGVPEHNFAVVCAKSKGSTPDVVTSIPDEAWIVYCEAKHVSSYYTQKARTGELNVNLYKERVLIIDEVDALIVDKDPTDEFVFDIRAREVQTKQGLVSIKDWAKDVVMSLGRENDMISGEVPVKNVDALLPEDSQSQAVFRELAKLVKQVKHWKQHPDGKYKDERGMWYGTDKNGQVNEDYKSNFLEVMRLLDSKVEDMHWYERLFVMSKPRVFKLYNRIIGFSGTVGNRMEQEFLAKAYGAHFFVVPPFLQTCEGPKVHGEEQQLYFVADWADKASWDKTLKGPAKVVLTEGEQIATAVDLAFEARNLVPVLIITKDDDQVKALEKKLEERAHDQRLLAADVVRPLNRSLFKTDPKQYKENLRLSTQVYSQMAGKNKTWRITITDPTGGRGTDYRMDDDDADEKGGLLLIILQVPPSERDWIQYKGRTARQKWKGQYCVVLNKMDYRGSEAIDDQILQDLEKHPADLNCCNALIQAILAVGLSKSKTDLEQIRAVYNAGFIANEVCEQVWTEFPPQRSGGTVDVGLDGDPRSEFMKICRMYRYLSYDDILKSASAISPEYFGTKYVSGVPDKGYEPEVLARPDKMVLFMYDVSYSMHNPVGATSRMGACKERLQAMMTDRRIIGDSDQVGVVAFGNGYSYMIQLCTGVAEKVPGLMDGDLRDDGSGRNVVDIQGKPAQNQSEGRGGEIGTATQFFYTLNALLQELTSHNEKWAKKLWLICLTDGEPSDAKGSDYSAAVTKLKTYGHSENNLIIITISDEVSAESEATFEDLAAIVQKEGGIGKYISAKDVTDDTAIRVAFGEVEAAMVDVSGMTE